MLPKLTTYNCYKIDSDCQNWQFLILPEMETLKAAISNAAKQSLRLSVWQLSTFVNAISYNYIVDTKWMASLLSRIVTCLLATLVVYVNYGVESKLSKKSLIEFSMYCNIMSFGGAYVKY